MKRACTGPFQLGTLLVLLTLLSTNLCGAEFQVPIGQRQLFLDREGIDKIVNLGFALHRPLKRGAVIRSPDPKKTIQTRAAPAWDPRAKLYKLWVITVDENLWQSADGLHWTPGPPTNMRIMLAAYDPRETDLSRRFKAPLLNQGFAVSADGATWKRVDVGKVPSSDEGNFSFDAENGLFIHTVKRGAKYGRALAVATSKDFVEWKDYGVVFQSDARDQQLGRKNIEARFADPYLHHPPYNDPKRYNVDVYNMGVFRYEGLYVGLPAMYHATGPVPNYPNTVGFHLIQVTCSRDLKTWRRVGDRATFIGPSRLGSGAYDLTQILPPSAPIVRGDELWFYYTGLKWRGTFKYIGKYPNGKTVLIPGKDRDGGGICLAVLRRDGFVSLDAQDQEGSLETVAFKLPADQMHVNVDAMGGELRVELLDEQSRVLAESKVVEGDQTRAKILWNKGELAKHLGRKVKLRFTLKDASLYSYWFTE